MKNKYKEINNLLKNEIDCYVIGGGTSLSGFDFNKLKNKFTIAINHSIEVYPQANCLIFGDKIFLKKTKFNIKNYKGKIFTSETCIKVSPLTEILNNDNVYIFSNRHDYPQYNAREGLFHPTSSGLLALNLAIQMKAQKIFLLGYDYYKKDGQMHFYEDYDHHLLYEEEKLFRKAEKFRFFNEWREKIINLNLKSFVDTFEKKSLKEVFG